MPSAAFNTGPDFHHLDHIAPLAEFLQIPLFIEEERNFGIAKHYYPTVDSHYLPGIESHFTSLVQQFDVFYGCAGWLPHLKQLLFDLYQKEIQLVYCAHGQSDKGYGLPLLKHMTLYDCILIYGNLLKDMLSELAVPTSYLKVGNYRLAYYLKYKHFYDALIEKEVFSHLPKDRKTILYAPTWEDSDRATSFFKQAPELFESIPPEYNLIIKAHPRLEENNPGQFYRIVSLLKQYPQHFLITEFPLIYPLLNRTDIYIGDYSSIGYDFLFFQRPMYFLLQNRLKIGRLHRCGTILENPQDLREKLKEETDHKLQQKDLYEYAFGKETHSLLGGNTNSVCKRLRSSKFEHTSISYA